MTYAQKKTRFRQTANCCAGGLEGSFLKALVRLTGAKSVLEVGMFTGTSTLAMAEALPADGKASSELLSRAWVCPGSRFEQTRDLYQPATIECSTGS